MKKISKTHFHNAFMLCVLYASIVLVVHSKKEVFQLSHCWIPVTLLANVV